MATAYITADNDVFIENLRDSLTETAINDATITFQLRDASLSAVTGASGTCTYVTSSSGNYKGVLESTVSLTESAQYWLDVTITSGTKNDFRRIPVYAKYRGSE